MDFILRGITTCLILLFLDVFWITFWYKHFEWRALVISGNYVGRYIPFHLWFSFFVLPFHIIVGITFKSIGMIVSLSFLILTLLIIKYLDRKKSDYYLNKLNVDSENKMNDNKEKVNFIKDERGLVDLTMHYNVIGFLIFYIVVLLLRWDLSLINAIIYCVIQISILEFCFWKFKWKRFNR